MIAVLVILGFVFSQGKGAWMIAGYNTSSKAKKAAYDEKALREFMGKLMFTFAGCWLVIASSELFSEPALVQVGLVLFLVASFGAVISMNTGGRFKKKA